MNGLPQSWDGWLHVNPFSVGETTPLQPGAKEVAVGMLFNPTQSTLTVTVAVPLYYAGLTDYALVSLDGGAPTVMPLNRDYSVHLPVVMPPLSIHTVVVNAPPA